MPGIFGYVKRHPSDAEVQEMAAELNHKDRFILDEHVSDNFVQFSHIHLPNFKTHRDIFFKAGVYICIEGEQYDYPSSVFEELLYHWYESGQLDARLSELDGYFNAMLYDSTIEKLFLISDRYGMRLLYVYNKDGRLAWSSEVKGLLALSFIGRNLDKLAYESFQELGYIIGDRTWFTDIKLIEPATILECDLRSMTFDSRQYWGWHQIKPTSMSFCDAVDEFGHHFLKAIEKRFEPSDKMGIALSGGLDSRAIFAAVQQLYPEYTGQTFTFGVEGCDDIEIAKLVAKRTSWNHRIYNFSEFDWFEPRMSKVNDSDGMLDMMHMHGSEFLEDISTYVNVNMNGYAADVICGGGWLEFLPADKAASKKNLQNIYGKFAELLEYNVEYYKIEKCEPHLLINKVRKFTNMGTICGLTHVEQRKPFFDNKIIELMYSLPDEFRMGNKLYSAMLLKFFPNYFEDIPWQKTRLTLKGDKSPLINSKNVIRSYINYAGAIRRPDILTRLQNLLNFEGSESGKVDGIDATETYLNPHLNSIKKNYITNIFRVATTECYLRMISENR